MVENEKELIRQSQMGDSEAFGRLYDGYIKPIYNFVYYKTFHKETAEDLTSETFLKALKHIQSVDLERSFQSWLYKIAQNTVLDHYRALRPTEDIDDFWDLSKDDFDVVEASDTKADIVRLREHLKTLTAIERDIIIMRIWQDVPYKTIAEITGKTEASCKMVYSRSLSKLRALMPLAVILLFLYK